MLPSAGMNASDGRYYPWHVSVVPYTKNLGIFISPQYSFQWTSNDFPGWACGHHDAGRHRSRSQRSLYLENLLRGRPTPMTGPGRTPAAASCKAGPITPTASAMAGRCLRPGRPPVWRAFNSARHDSHAQREIPRPVGRLRPRLPRERSAALRFQPGRILYLEFDGPECHRSLQRAE